MMASSKWLRRDAARFRDASYIEGLLSLAENVAIYIDEIVHPNLGRDAYAALLQCLSNSVPPPPSGRERLSQKKKQAYLNLEANIADAIAVIVECGAKDDCSGSTRAERDRNFDTFIEAAKRGSAKPRNF